MPPPPPPPSQVCKKRFLRAAAAPGMHPPQTRPSPPKKGFGEEEVGSQIRFPSFPPSPADPTREDRGEGGLFRSGKGGGGKGRYGHPFFAGHPPPAGEHRDAEIIWAIAVSAIRGWEREWRLCSDCIFLHACLACTCATEGNEMFKGGIVLLSSIPVLGQCTLYTVRVYRYFSSSPSLDSGRF